MLKYISSILVFIILLNTLCLNVFAVGAPDPADIDSKLYKSYSGNTEQVIAKDGTLCYVYRNTGYDFSKEFPVQEVYNQGTEVQMESLKKIYQTFLSWGMTKEGSAAICGNIMLESNADPSRINCIWSDWSDLFHRCNNGEYGMGYPEGIGIIQFTDPSWIYALACLASTRGVTIADLGVQLLVLNYAYGPLYTETYGKEVKEDDFLKYFYTENVNLSNVESGIKNSPYFSAVSSMNMTKVNVLTAYYMVEQERPASSYCHLSERVKWANTVLDNWGDVEGKDYSNSGVSTNNSDENSSDLNLNIIVDEWNLTGMPEKSGLVDGVVLPTLATRDGLSLKEKYNLSEIGDALDLDSQFNSWTTARVCIVFVGLLIVVYALFLALSLLFDRINSFINISLVHILTLGKVYCCEDESIGIDQEQQGKYISVKRLVILIVFLFIVGCIFISGGVIPMVIKGIYDLSSFIKNIFSV